MPPHSLRDVSRRRLLQFLAASPLLAREALAEGPLQSDPVQWAPRDLDKLITDPKKALDVFDFEPVMKKNVPPAHFGYMATGVNDDATLRANREGFAQIGAAAAPTGRCQQDRHERRDFGSEVRQPDRDRADRQQPRLP